MFQLRSDLHARHLIYKLLSLLENNIDKEATHYTLNSDQLYYATQLSQ